MLFHGSQYSVWMVIIEINYISAVLSGAFREESYVKYAVRNLSILKNIYKTPASYPHLKSVTTTQDETLGLKAGPMNFMHVSALRQKDKSGAESSRVRHWLEVNTILKSLILLSVIGSATIDSLAAVSVSDSTCFRILNLRSCCTDSHLSNKRSVYNASWINRKRSWKSEKSYRQNS